MYKLRVADIILAVCLFLVAVALFFLDVKVVRGKWVLVKSPSFSGRYLLSKNRVVRFKALKGEFELSISNRRAWITETHCAYQKCKNMGKIYRPGQTLICVPQSIEILISGKKKVDVVCH